MYLERKIDKFLSSWKEDKDRKPLIVKGARQIGKTESIMHFAKNNYKRIIYINFALDTKFRTICADGYDYVSIIKSITLIDPSKTVEKGNTLLFFDELQDYPEIATSLKSFCLCGDVDVICSGSMLGINYKRIESNSVGYKEEYEMESFDFEEFLWAKGYGQNTVDEMLLHMQNGEPFSQTELNVYNKLFMDYIILGGMPAVIKRYLETESFSGSLKIQKDLITDYKEDIKKYVDGREKTKVLNVFNHIPVQLAQENKKFQISKVEKGARFKNYWGCIEWLEDAGMINVCYCLHTPDLPLKGNYEEEKYKIYFKDTGLLIASLDAESQEDLRANKNMNIYKGALYENVVAEALHKQGYDLFYYKRENSTLEEDFFVRTQEDLIPVEVKATNGSAKSLTTLINSEKYPDIKWGIKLIQGNIGKNGNVQTFPYFCAFLLNRFLGKCS